MWQRWLVLAGLATSIVAAGERNVIGQGPFDTRGFGPLEADRAAFVREALDFLVTLRMVDSLPEDPTHIVVLQDVLGDYRLLPTAALPRRWGYTYELLSNVAAQQRVNRAAESMRALTVDRVSTDLNAGTAEIKLKMEQLVPSGSNLIVLCCCSETASFRRLDDRWVFVGFTLERECL
jgi:hypothetical protein